MTLSLITPTATPPAKARTAARIEQGVFAVLLMVGSGALVGTSPLISLWPRLGAYLLCGYMLFLATWILRDAITGELGKHAPTPTPAVEPVEEDGEALPHPVRKLAA